MFSLVLKKMKGYGGRI